MKKSRALKYAISLLTLLSVVLCTGCGGMAKSKQAAEQEIVKFHAFYDQEKFAEIYFDSHAKFKETRKEKQFLKTMSAVYRRLGTVSKTTSTRVDIRTSNRTTIVVLTQETTFERGGGTEVFAFQIDGSRANLIDYSIHPDVLILA